MERAIRHGRKALARGLGCGWWLYLQLAIEVGMGRQRRFGIHASSLKSHIVGPDVALFKHIDTDARLLGGRNGLGM